MTARRAAAAGMVLMMAGVGVAGIAAQPAPETFSGTASIRKGSARVSAPFSVTITQYASTAERDAVLAAVRQGGSEAARKTLATMADAGAIELGDRRTPIKFAVQRPSGSGRLVTVLTAEPIAYVGAGLPNARPRTGFDVALAILDVQESTGVGELVPAAKIGLDHGGALVTEDYGAMVVWLHDLVRRE
jgi:hypothetical protein